MRSGSITDRRGASCSPGLRSSSQREPKVAACRTRFRAHCRQRLSNPYVFSGRTLPLSICILATCSLKSEMPSSASVRSARRWVVAEPRSTGSGDCNKPFATTAVEPRRKPPGEYFLLTDRPMSSLVLLGLAVARRFPGIFH